VLGIVHFCLCRLELSLDDLCRRVCESQLFYTYKCNVTTYGAYRLLSDNARVDEPVSGLFDTISEPTSDTCRIK
jgi:hypothetical protein